MNFPEAGSPKTLLETVKIGNYAVKVYCDNDEIFLRASGFTMQFPEKPNRAVTVKRDSRPASILLDDSDSLRELDELGAHWRKKLHARIRSDWDKKCFVADAKGQWQHPIFKDMGTHFSCNGCDSKFPGAAVAANLWHCPTPDCYGTPIHMHSSKI
jgi:hypothetical protein